MTEKPNKFSIIKCDEFLKKYGLSIEAFDKAKLEWANCETALHSV